MYCVGDHVQFEYDDLLIHGVIVPYNGQSRQDHSDSSYLIKLEGFVDRTIDPSALYYHGWADRRSSGHNLYLWIDPGAPSLEYYRPPMPQRPVSPVFYTVKEVG